MPVLKQALVQFYAGKRLIDKANAAYVDKLFHNNPYAVIYRSLLKDMTCSFYVSATWHAKAPYQSAPACVAARIDEGKQWRKRWLGVCGAHLCPGDVQHCDNAAALGQEACGPSMHVRHN